MKSNPPVWTLRAFVLAGLLLTRLDADSLSEDENAVTLPLEIHINGSSHGEVIVRASPSLDIVEVEGATLKELLVGTVSSNLVALVESLPDNFISLQGYRELGLEIHLDLESLVITLQIQEAQSKHEAGPRSISLGHQRELNFDAHAPSAGVSGYLNFRSRSTFSSHEGSPSESIHTLSASHVLNIGGFALEGESVINESDGFSTRELRLVKDDPKRLLRYSAGDISTPINELQRGFQLFGLNVAREFGIQPYRTFTPTGSASFDLEESATVRVMVNGRPARTLQLDAGSYNIEEFKLAAGANRMDLQIETESGIVDQLSVSEFGSVHLLDSGVSTYSLSVGLPKTSASASDSSAISDSDWYQRFVEDNLVFSGYFRQGLTNQMTASVDLQGSPEWRRLGVSLNTANRFLGTTNLSLSANQTCDGRDGLSSRLTWNRDLQGYNFSFSSLYASEAFSLYRADQQPSERDVRFSSSLSVSKLFNESLNVSLNLLQQTRHDGSRSQTVSTSLGRRFASFYAGLTCRYNRSARHREYGSYLTFTWNPAVKWRARSQLRYSNIEGGSSVSSQFDYASRRKDDYFNARLNLQRSDVGYGFDGSLSYETGLYGASFSHNEVYGSIDDFVEKGRDTTLNLESAIAFADGSLGLARRVRDSFAIIDKHEAWSDVSLGINPTIGGFQKRGKGKWLSPVLSDLASYREDYATIQTVDSDFFLERNDYYFFPSYRRGVRLQLGDDAIYALRSTLHYEDGEPVKYKAVQLIHESGEKVNTFTNAVGRFVATGLRLGSYTLSAPGTERLTRVRIEEGEVFVFVDSLTLDQVR